jgi:hypothetical protein
MNLPGILCIPPNAQVVSLGMFIRAFDGSKKRDSKEAVVVFVWGPFLVVGPRYLGQVIEWITPFSPR